MQSHSHAHLCGLGVTLCYYVSFLYIAKTLNLPPTIMRELQRKVQYRLWKDRHDILYRYTVKSVTVSNKGDLSS